jgi:hypothetical protein
MKMNGSTGRLVSLALVLAAGLVACGGPLHFSPHGTPKAPDAEAEIVADVNTSEAITKINIQAQHLAPPERLADEGTTFVVWARKNDGKDWQRVGALTYDADKRTGELTEASVPHTAFDLAVTVETQATPPAPSPNVVLFQRVED